MDIAKYLEQPVPAEKVYKPSRPKPVFNRPSSSPAEFDPRVMTVEQASLLTVDQMRVYAEDCQGELTALDTEQVRHVFFFWLTGQRKLAYKYAENSRFENLKRLST